MKILLTGGLGHIGSYFIETLTKKKNIELVVLDSLKTQRYSSLFNFSKNCKFIFIEEDIKNLSKLKDKLKKIDIVIHLAALTDAASSVGRQKEFIDNVSFCGRLANYTYINQDQAIAQAFGLFKSFQNE